MHELLRMAHLIMISMGTGLVAAHYVMLRASAGQEGPSGRTLALARRTLADVITFVLVFIWITGVSLLWSRTDPVSAWFYAKLFGVGLFTAAHLMQRLQASRIAATGDLVALRQVVERWVSVAWLSALVTICLAVISFQR